MNKTEIRRAINKEFFTYVESNHSDYIIDETEGDGTVSIIDSENSVNLYDSISYHKGRHDLIILEQFASDKTKRDFEVMEKYLNDLVESLSK
jgi:hypothetical protein